MVVPLFPPLLKTLLRSFIYSSPAAAANSLEMTARIMERAVHYTYLNSVIEGRFHICVYLSVVYDVCLMKKTTLQSHNQPKTLLNLHLNVVKLSVLILLCIVDYLITVSQNAYLTTWFILFTHLTVYKDYVTVVKQYMNLT